MPESFWVGLVVFVVMVAAWVAGLVFLRVRRRHFGDSAALLSPVDRTAARDELASGRDGIAIGMAVRGGQMRQGR